MTYIDERTYEQFRADIGPAFYAVLAMGGSSRLTVAGWRKESYGDAALTKDADGEYQPIFRTESAARSFAAALSVDGGNDVMVAKYPTLELAKTASRGEWAIPVRVYVLGEPGNYRGTVGTVVARY